MIRQNHCPIACRSALLGWRSSSGSLAMLATMRGASWCNG